MDERGIAWSWDDAVWKTLTGMEVGISLKVYSLLLAKGCRPRSSHTDWEEESRLTKDRKDWWDRKWDRWFKI